MAANDSPFYLGSAPRPAPDGTPPRPSLDDIVHPVSRTVELKHKAEESLVDVPVTPKQEERLAPGVLGTPSARGDKRDKPSVSSTFWKAVACTVVAAAAAVVVLAMTTLVTMTTASSPGLEAGSGDEAGSGTPISGGNATRLDLGQAALGNVAHELDVLLQPLAHNLSGVLPCDQIDPAVLTCPTGLRGVETALIVASVILMLGLVMLAYRRLTRGRARSVEADPLIDPEL